MTPDLPDQPASPAARPVVAPPTDGPERTTADATATAAESTPVKVTQLSEGGTEQQPDQLPGGPRKRRRRGRRRRRGDAGKNGGANEQADVEANSTSPIGSPVSSPTGAPTSRAPQIPKSADGDDAEDDDTDDEVGSGTPSAPVPTFIVSGIVDVATQGGKIVTNVDGRIRQLGDGLIDAESDPYITPDAIARFGLRPSQRITADVAVRKPRRRRANNRQPRPIVERVTEIEGLPPEVYAARKPFADLTALDPAPRLNLEHKNCPPACRLIDLFCPIGFGTRGLIVAPPKAGKTILLQNIAFGIKCNYPEVELIALLIDERPEEVTDFKRNVPAHVLASSNDQDLDRHLSLGILAIERAKRMVEAGKDVVVLLDSLTRLGRAFNNSKRYGSSGKIMSGGLDSRALEVPKQLFGAARRAEEGGSLTIIATCLVDTGSRADQIIFEEFKGTGNMELILDRTISDRRLFPAINLAASGTRKEHLLMSERELKTVTALRRRLHSVPPAAQIEQLLAALQRFETNEKLVSG